MTATYPNAPETLIARWQERRTPLDFARGEALPPLDSDLVALTRQTVADPGPERPRRASGFAIKRHALARELVGQPELVLLHAVLIACLRKRDWPRHAPALFLRLWSEQADWLIVHLPDRWKISAAITFADHGATEAQRRLGQSLNLMFSLMKLYEAERLYSGRAPDDAFGFGRKVDAPLPLGMPGFSLGSGGLDYNLLAPIWSEAQATPILGPLASHLLDRLNADPGTLFRRLQSMRNRREQRRKAAKPPDP
ncbi:hypothetical protein L0V05_12215 [Tabrizicola sp. J26]|uniref:hypothetical protein n=1 Tax=Alitabrizicola rongguiensis TaxID=2909234 RepID=UPI001F2D5B54|nr:hypothetical protein [Tabrizicola rongguiensis]MCF1709580.1 hypothetical protein [Tabrizicola rongguiensis]